MAWQNFLFFADGSKAGPTRAMTAAMLAAQHSAQLEICSPVILPTVVSDAETSMIAAVYDDMLAQARKSAHETGEAALAIAGSCNAAALLITPEVGRADLVRVAGELGQTADLVIVGQHVEGDQARETQALLAAGLFSSGRPVLMLPAWTRPHTVGARVLVAWKPTREASRAVHDALPLLQSAAAVRIFTGADESKGKHEYSVELSRLTRHLEAHGVPLSQADAGPSPRGITVLEEAERWGADLLVMGAYGHSRLQEIVFGGVTRDVIRHSPIAVLLSH